MPLHCLSQPAGTSMTQGHHVFGVLQFFLSSFRVHSASPIVSNHKNGGRQDPPAVSKPGGVPGPSVRIEGSIGSDRPLGVGLDSIQRCRNLGAQSTTWATPSRTFQATSSRVEWTWVATAQAGVHPSQQRLKDTSRFLLGAAEPLPGTSSAFIVVQAVAGSRPNKRV